MSSQKNNDRHIIWSNIHLDLDDWKDDLKAQYPTYNEEELYEMMVTHNDEYLNDERTNLNIILPRPIILIADIGRWNGRFSGCTMIDSGNIKDCFYSNTDYSEWYVDRYGDLRADAIHHDGTNHYLYRLIKDGVSDVQIENLQSKIYERKVTRSDISRLTSRIGDEIAKVYGFSIKKQRQTQKAR